MKPNTKRNSTGTSTKLIAWLGRFFAVLFSIVLLLPALLLPLTTAVPAWVWAPMRELTPDRFIEDAHALTLYLHQRFQQEKFYVYGVSWTSILPGSTAVTGLAAKTWINLWR